MGSVGASETVIAPEPSSWWQRLFDPDEPWVWLFYSPLYFFPWINKPFSTFDLAVSVTALAVLLAVYVGGARANGRWLVGCAAIILVESIILSRLGGNWTVFTIYATSMIARLRPSRRAMGFVAGFCGTAFLAGIVQGGPPIWWMPGVFLATLVGGATVSRTALREKNLALIAAQEEVRKLTRITERERITRDLHDLIGRTLTLIVIKADLADRLLRVDQAAAGQEIREIAAAARRSLSDVREALAGMSHRSLAREVNAARDVLGAARIACTIDGAPDDIPDPSGAVLAMVLREAVTNVVRHSGAANCQISIRQLAEQTTVDVVDDGCGGTFREGSGLAGMRVRLTAAGGELSVEPLARGTRLAARMPAR